MTIPIKPINHLSFAPMKVLRDLIVDNVTDINATRRAVGGQWIFPTVPEANDENYPRVAIINRSVSESEYGAGRYMEMERDGSGNAEKMIFGKVAILPMSVIVFVKKKQRHEVEYFDGTTHILTNTKQADYLGEKIAKEIEINRQKYFIANNMDIAITGMSRSYDDGGFLIAKTINVEIESFDKWGFDFTDPAYDEGIIADYEVNATI